MVHTYNRSSFGLKKNKIMTHAPTWMHLEDMMLSETSQNNNRTYIKKENNLRNWVTQLRGYQVQPARQAGRLGIWRSQHPDSEATM